jgi:branched-chain amino acid transport system substrate-binding protein
MAMRRALLLIAMLAGCGQATAPDDAIPVGLLLSYSGGLAANSTNSERALRLAVEMANASGGLWGRQLELIPRDTRSDPSKVSIAARELMDRHAALIIGPDTSDTAVELRGMLDDETIILPSFSTAHANFRRPVWWFVMGAGTARVACELHAQLVKDGHVKPVILADASNYGALVAWEMTRRYSYPEVLLPQDQSSNSATIEPIIDADADAYVLAAQPQAASSLIYAMAAIGRLKDPTSWYLSPTLHTPALLATIPGGALNGARGVAPGQVAGANDFRRAFQARWQDLPLDDAYAFYDAGAIAVLALGRSLAREGSVAAGHHLGVHVAAVTHGKHRVAWNELAQGLRWLNEGLEVEYEGLSGSIEFDLTGQTPRANMKWWTISPDGFDDDLDHPSGCNDSL